MIDTLSSAAAGLRSSANAFEKSAQRVVRSTVLETGQASAGADDNGDDLPAAIVDTKASEISFKANAAVFKTADKMIGTLLDTVV